MTVLFPFIYFLAAFFFMLLLLSSKHSLYYRVLLLSEWVLIDTRIEEIKQPQPADLCFSLSSLLGSGVCAGFLLCFV